MHEEGTKYTGPNGTVDLKAQIMKWLQVLSYKQLSCPCPGTALSPCNTDI